MIKQQVKSKTNWFGTAILILGYLQTNIDKLSQFLGEYQGIVYTILGVGVIIFRQITTKPISEK